MPDSKRVRVEFTANHDSFLEKYLARHCPSKQGRSGRTIFQRLVANERNRWPWSVHHTWQSWRERYVKNADAFDRRILQYQRKHNIKPTEGQKRAAEPVPIEMPGRSAKRAKLEVEERVSSSETHTEQNAAAQHASSNSSRSEMISKCPCKPQESLSRVHPSEPEPADVGPSSPPCSTNNTNTDATNKSPLDLPAIQTRNGTLEIPSSPNQLASPPTDGEPGLCSPPRAVKRKERPRASSVVFASEPPSPRRDPAVVNVGGAPVTNTVYQRAPPRIVDSFHGHVLVDRKGHVPRALTHREEDGEEEEEDKARWPPLRGRTTKQKTESRPAVEVNAHHAFSQPQPHSEDPLESVAMGKREQGKPCHPFEQVPRSLDGPLPNRRTAAALFLAGSRRGMAPRVESSRREDTTRNGASPVKRIVRTAPTAPPTPLSGLIPNSKALKFPPPRASTRSPFRPEPSAREAGLRPRSRTKAARHPALSHIRRQTIGHEHEHGRAREHRPVPSVDLVAMSRSSTSAQSHSRSSADASIPTRPSRQSLPAFACLAPWLIDEPEGVPSAPGPALKSGSPLRWGASSPVYADIRRHAWTPSLGGTSSPRFMFTSPARSITAVATDTDASASHPNAIPTSSSLSISPHRPDVPLTASHGLASILAHMSANHGLALGVVEAVYTRVRSLREADEVLRGMREAAEEFGEREIEKRVKGRHEEPRGRNGVGHRERGAGRQGIGDGDGDGMEQKGTLLKYVVASEDEEGSEYSPPETSRAAMWKHQSESASHSEEGEEMKGDGEGGEGDGDGDDEEEEEGRAVDEELWEAEGEGGNDDGKGLPDDHHDFLQALLGDVEAQELENKIGRRQFRREVARRFV